MTETSSITESIFDGEQFVIPMAEVVYIEKDPRDGYAGAINIIMSATRWNFEHDCWDNFVYLGQDQGPEFLRAWCRYRAEREGLI